MPKFRKWQGEPVDLHVCLRKRLFPEDFESKCSRCGETIYHKEVAKSKLICIECVVQAVELGADEFDIAITDEAIAILKDMIQRGKT